MFESFNSFRQTDLHFLCRTDNVEESEDVANAGEALVGGSDDLHDAGDDSLGRVGVQDAVGQRLNDADRAIGAVALCKCHPI